ncbi:MAG: 3-phosphoshikimate 1-carboxyvinyltransferase [Acidobacteria bacterium RIFCSPLOWO2_12_FULL_67_14]|nr:MAG: 3-phosphoshikimate 1-carboxyvinyltransferase [Acidobacteria bacterium RIFCSPLOWO2_02_FULL_67_21]OFW35358.1 MAG: 3-phosphoshikimate 1-carboxyvinyltransferase [Acidobacteria bacterium RIFCSPLOWO2_12_FULL_67_14]
MPTTAVMVEPASRVRGRVRPPGDKSISHRYALLAAMADGTSIIRGYSTGGDCASTLRCLRGLGVEIRQTGTDDEAGVTIEIAGRGLRGLVAPGAMLDAGNSGSTIRMLSGLLAAHPFRTSIAGDASLRRRPMRRIIVPLERMGARFVSDDGRPPLTVEGTLDLAAIDFAPDVPSAQVKSAVLLAGLHAHGTTRVREPLQTRDHTERALRLFGATVHEVDGGIALAGGQRLSARSLSVPGDLSSAAFWMVAAAALPGSEIVVEDVGLNPTRTGILGILERAGARIDTVASGGGDEPVGTLRVRHGGLRDLVIAPEEVPGVIDELPVLAALATHGGSISVSGAQELRVKESDRISALADGLRRMGAEIEEQPDGFRVRGSRRLPGGEVDARNDHRLAMAFAVAALGASGPTTIHDAGAAAVSYPQFFSVLESLRA